MANRRKTCSKPDGHDISTILVEGAGHRFSEPDQIDILLAHLGEVTLAASKI